MSLKRKARWQKHQSLKNKEPIMPLKTLEPKTFWRFIALHQSLFYAAYMLFSLR